MTTPRKKAVVVGALGVIGRYNRRQAFSRRRLAGVGLSRRPARNEPRYSHISVDLLDLKDVGRKLGSLSDATHNLYAAVQPGTGKAADYATVVAPNRDMLVIRSAPSPGQTAPCKGSCW